MKLTKLIIAAALTLVQLYSKAQHPASAPDTAWWNGHYRSYRWIGEDVTEMVQKQADSYIGQEMDISPTRFRIFVDTVDHPAYKLQRIERKEFLHDYTISPDTFKSLGDSLTILSVYEADANLDRSIILAKDLIVNYRGCFYYFRRRRFVRS
jgi:hypothetical protein